MRILTAALFAALAWPAQAPPAVVKTYVYFTPSADGFVDPRTTGLADSVKVIRNELRGEKDLVAVVDTAAAADLLVEITARRTRFQPDTFELTEKLLLSYAVERRKADRMFMEVLATVRGAELSKELTGQWSSVDPRAPSWRWPEVALSNQIEAWIKSQRAGLTAAHAALSAPATAAAGPAAVRPKRPTTRLKVFCAASAAPAPSAVSSGQDRADSVKDLAEQIGEHHKDWLEVVATRTEADVIVEIVDRSSHQWRHHTRDKLKDGTLAMPIMGEYRVEAVIRRNDYNTPVTGVGADVRATWRYAAADVADQLEDWTTDNYGKLPTLQK